MNSHSLIYKMRGIKSTQQNDQGVSEKKVLLCMASFVVELTARDIHYGQLGDGVQMTQSNGG